VVPTAGKTAAPVIHPAASGSAPVITSIHLGHTALSLKAPGSHSYLAASSSSPTRVIQSVLPALQAAIHALVFGSVLEGQRALLERAPFASAPSAPAPVPAAPPTPAAAAAAVSGGSSGNVLFALAVLLALLALPRLVGRRRFFEELVRPAPLALPLADPG
jgi:hypothetical protein